MARHLSASHDLPLRHRFAAACSSTALHVIDILEKMLPTAAAPPNMIAPPGAPPSQAVVNSSQLSQPSLTAASSRREVLNKNGDTDIKVTEIATNRHGTTPFRMSSHDVAEAFGMSEQRSSADRKGKTSRKTRLNRFYNRIRNCKTRCSDSS